VGRTQIPGQPGKAGSCLKKPPRNLEVISNQS
jgi:hypothetical protein